MLYQVGEKTLCFHGPLIYQAKVLKAEKWSGDDNASGQTGPHYLVHYQGWKQTWDEWVPESRLLKLNDENLAKQKALVEARKAGPSTSSGGGGPSGGSGGAERGKDTPGRKSAREGSDATEKKTTGGGARGTKRGRETVEQEEEYVKRPEIKISIPDPLKVQLVDDWENITKKSELVPLPRKPNVREIIEEYRAHYLSQKSNGKPGRSPAVLNEVLAGLKLYFDRSLGQNLLYRFERTQFVEMRKKNGPKMGDGDLGNSGALGGEKEPSDVYGAEHLLRLFVNLPGIIAHTSMDSESISLLREHLAEFLQFMVKERHRLFVREYEAASPAYHRLSST
ncbi:NuA4 histone acetyltransferase complex, Eaf3/MRG15 subunit [Violaceomyces palustris]|uniref:NuA4 histone acetyltransferase complex, Eaf3/MRG15 subunit n=1 Tax=Violaceomyces palustris TaxID=1673888 RepID=A0ACD0P3Q5_9BASI|nr:NuA4 histone acetyltransferase complex, Eaf3/MRG15 subunit [Violaceomyces palustris]